MNRSTPFSEKPDYVRFKNSDVGDQIDSEYDMPSSEIQDLISRAPQCFSVKTLDLTVAGTLAINEPGFGFVFYGYNKSDNSKNSESFIQAFVNQGDPSDASQAFPGKTGRGFRGSFTKLFLSWPAQTESGDTILAQFIIFKSRKYPWIGGEEAL